MTPTTTPKWVTPLLPLAVAAVVFLLGEAAARTAVWWQYGDPRHEIQESLNYAPFLITSGDSSVFTIRPRRPGALRLLWLGSSTAAQFSREELEDAFGAFFGREIEVFNLAQGGYNSSQQLVQMTLYGMQLQPDLVVTLDGINDIVSVTKTAQPGIPYFNLTIEQALHRPTTFWLGRLFSSSQLVNAFRKLSERRREVAVQGNPELIKATVQLYRQNALKISLIARGIGARHVAILQPYLHLRQDPPVAEQALSRNWAYRKRFMSAVLRQLDETLASTRFPDNARYINGLAAYDTSGGTVCFVDEAHLTTEGRRILLNRVVAALSLGS